VNQPEEDLYADGGPMKWPDDYFDIDDSRPGLAEWHRTVGFMTTPSWAPEVVSVHKGPPGTGKTTWLCDEFVKEAAAATWKGAERLGFMPFSNAAVDQAKRELRRVGAFDASDLRNVRTMHSAACALVKVDQSKLMTDARRAKFRQEKFPTVKAHDAKRYDTIIDRCLAKNVAREDLMLEVTAVEAKRISGEFLFRYYDAFVEYLAEKKLITFDEVLRRILASKGTGNELVPDIDVLFIDEAQDLSPTAAAVVEMWARRCKQLYVAGDDDQAIYGFAGADPTWFQQLFREHNGSTLHQSHRVPAKVHEVAMQVITQVQNRLDTPYEPTAKDGEVIRGVTIAQLPKFLDGKTNLVLARDGWALGGVKKVLADAGRIFTEMSGASGRADRELATSVATLLTLSRGGEVRAPDLSRVIERRQRADEQRFLKRLADLSGSFVSRTTLLQMGQTQLLSELDTGRHRSALGKLTKREKQVVEALMGAGGSPPDIILSTIHAAKGGQAEVVALVPDRSRTSFDAAESDAAARDDELRLLYVALTRTQRRLILLAPSEPRQAFRAFKVPNCTPRIGPSADRRPEVFGGIYT
jgi:superfamily I DNA/RNA helicase